MSAALHPSAPILLVDDEEQALHSYDLNLRFNGLNNTIRCSDSRKVRDLLRKREMSLVMIDLSMPHVGGEELLAHIRAEHPHLPVIVVTGHNEVEVAVRCMRAGSLDYLVKPVDRSRLLSAVHAALAARPGPAGPAAAEPADDAFAHMVAASEAMRAVCRYIASVATTAEPVLITGETGVGKELAARSIHLASGRRGRFVAVNAAGLDDNMFADTLFGHAKGAFTGAAQPRAGLVEEAAGGTLFLDEVGDLSPASQLKLLRLIQEREYYPLGSDACKAMDARIVVATNRPMDALMEPDGFRRDLLFRLRTHYIHLPPLRERPDDLPLLADHFLAQAARRLGKTAPPAPPELLHLLAGHPFPGNIRELEAMIFNAMALHETGKLSLAAFRAWIGSIRGRGQPPRELLAHGHDALEARTLRQAKEEAIREALERAGGNQSAAARLLGISRQALNRRLLRNRA